jgi:glutathione synthase/RimK-type ligase-like ATP-grasp enzyme
VFPIDIGEALRHARALVAKAEDEAAKQAYLNILRADPTHPAALNELGTLALSGGFRTAARSAYLQAVRHHPRDKIVRVNLANLLREEHDLAAARLHYQAALAIDPDFPEAHQGMAGVLNELGLEGAEQHRQKGFPGHAVVAKPYRGTGIGVPLLLLVSARGGNIPTQLWISDRRFAVTAVYAEFHDPALPLPAHALIVNAVGDADLCDIALARAEEIVARSAAPVINSPARVRLTGRAENARRLAAVEGLITPKIRALSRAAILANDDLVFPLLLRRPGFHTGRHFVRVEDRDALAPAIAALAAEELLLIQYLDARGPDGMARKYRVMFIDGAAYPLHLAISTDWKVHYFSAGMAGNAAHRDEERRFLEDMPAVLGPAAMAALARIHGILGLEYGGIDFALAADGSVLLFEANATMVVFPPNPEAIWDYRRSAIDRILKAAAQMLLRHAER